MLWQYVPIAILIVLATGLAFAIVLMAHMLGPSKPTHRKMMPYESGMVPIGPGMRRQPIRFYRIAMLFLLFDIEVIFLLPWAVVSRKLGLFGFIEVTIFVLILLVGYLYAWKGGALEWV